MAELNEYLTVPEAAKVRKVTRQAILALIERGVRAVEVGRQWLLHRKDLAAFVPSPRGMPSPAFGRNVVYVVAGR